MIIGLLIGGILRGQELLENSRTVATAQQVTSYSGAKITFMDAYAAFPGDMPNAQNRINGCTATTACYNGNGNGMLGISTADITGQPWTDIDPAMTSENTQFWKHLSLTHLISGINPVAMTPEWGQSHPTAKIGGGFFARYANYGGNAGAGQSSNHFLVLRNMIAGTWGCGGGAGGSTGQCAISPMRAFQIDKKMDDGVAGTGDVIAVSANWTSGCGITQSAANGTSGYQETADEKACDMMFLIK